MPLLKYKITPNDQEMHIHLNSHANREGQTVLRIGTSSGPSSGVDILSLAVSHGIAPVHAWIYETKSPPQFVLVDWAPGLTWVNEVLVTRLKILNHEDVIRIGPAGKTGPVEIVFQEILSTVLSNEFECQVCCRIYKPGCLVFQCPKCIDRVYCFECVVHGGLKCHCGYNFKTVVSSILMHANLKQYFPKAVTDTFVIETLDEFSPLIDKRCSVKPHRITRTNLVQSFKPGDRVIYCPECRHPYHLECWLRLDHCVHTDCRRTPIQENLMAILSADM